MKNQSPKVFISSTFYDLKQIRADISEFIEDDLGYKFLRSEHSSFPVNPDISTVQNCKNQVQDCDLMILIIGGRYGNIPDDDIKSITNLEYLTAKSRHIPTFIFVVNNVLSLYPVWEENSDSNFSSVVDSNELFNFIKSIKQESKWIFPFDTAQDIVTILRTQFAYFMCRGIELINKASDQVSIVDKLFGNAFKIALEKPVGWPGLLLSELIKQEVDKRIEKRIAYKQLINIGIGEIVKDENMLEWILAKNDEALRFMEGLIKIINESIREAFDSKDISKLFHSAGIIGNAYEEALDWSLRMRKCYVSDYFKDYLKEMSLILEDSIEKIESLSELIQDSIGKAISTSEEETIEIKLVVSIKIKNEKEWQQKLDSIKKYLS